MDLHRLLTTALIAAAAAAAAPAAAAPAPPPPPRPPAPADGAVADPLLACGGHLAERYGISLEEGCRRMRSQDHILPLLGELRGRPWPGFSSLRLRHAPSYAIVVAFKGGASEAVRAAVLARAHPSIRRDIVFSSARRTAAEIDRDQDRIVAALHGLEGGWSGGYEVEADRYGFTFATEGLVEEARRRVPADLRSDVDLRVGPVPVILAT